MGHSEKVISFWDENLMIGEVVSASVELWNSNGKKLSSSMPDVSYLGEIEDGQDKGSLHASNSKGQFIHFYESK